MSVTDYESHFDRALTDGKYDIVVYDYRDRDKLTDPDAANANVNTSATGKIKIPYSYLVPGTEAESVIRDMDIAESMVAYSNHNILLQASASVLSQANQSSQMILQLLQ